MHTFILYFVLAFPTHRIYLQQFASSEACEKVAAGLNTLSEDSSMRGDYICFERRVEK